MRRGVRNSFACLFVILAGCGLKEYEEKMVRAQARLERWEKEFQYLDAPLGIPVRMGKDEKAVSLLPIFLRPPRGINISPENFREPRFGLMFTFKSKGNSGPFKNVEVAQGDAAPEFPAEVMRCFTATSTPQKRSRDIRGFLGQQTRFITQEFEDGEDFYSVNFAKIGNDQVAISYRVIAGQKASALRVIDLSLETFAAGPEVTRAREFFDKGALTVPGHPK